MRSRWVGASFWDFLIFVVLIAGAAFGVNYFLRKPAVVAPAPVVVQSTPTPAVVVEEQPATRPAGPVIVVAPPVMADPVPVAFMAPPPVPQCVMIEENLRIAEAAAARARLGIAAVKKACLDRLGQTAEYRAAADDLKTKTKAKEDASDRVAKDGGLGLDADRDEQDKKTATQDWIAAVAKATKLESDALAADAIVGEKERILKGTSDDVARLRRKLNDYVASAIADNAASDDCPLGKVKLDVDTWTVTTEMKPKKQAVGGAMADAAMNEIGRILQRTMSRSAFTWDTAKFTVYGDYKGKKAVEFQAIYQRSAVDQVKLVTTDGEYFDDQALVTLAKGFWVSPVVEQMQGGTAVRPKGEDSTNGPRWLTLTIGGYSRADGSICPPIIVRCLADESRASSFTAIIPGHPSMPALYRDRPMEQLGAPLDHSRPQ